MLGRNAGQSASQGCSDSVLLKSSRRRPGGLVGRTPFGLRDRALMGLMAFRIAAYLKNGGTLENAAPMANHASTARRRSMIGDLIRLAWMRSNGCGSEI